MHPELFLLPDDEAPTRGQMGSIRVYSHRGHSYPGVTTILGRTADKSGLEAWIKRVGKEEADRIKKAAALRGTQTHNAIENYYLHNDDSCDLPYFKSFLRLKNRIKNVRLLEAPVVNHKRQYGGTIDIVADFDDVTAVLDFKTADKKKRLEYIVDYKLQTVSYAGALNSHPKYQLELGMIRRTVVLIFIPDQEPQVVVTEGDEIREYWHCFMERRQQFAREQGL